MTDSTIQLRFKAPDTQWKRSLGSHKNPVNTLPDFWHQQMKNADAHLYKALSKLCGQKFWPGIEGWEIKDGFLSVSMNGGLLGNESTELLLPLLNKAGCQAVEAVFYTDECDYITDAEDVEHPLGIRYFINQSGQLDEEDYPEIEYEYYD